MMSAAQSARSICLSASGSGDKKVKIERERILNMLSEIFLSKYTRKVCFLSFLLFIMLLLNDQK